MNYSIIKEYIKDKARDFGFLGASVASITIARETRDNFNEWIAKGYQGDMDYLERNRELRFNPKELKSETLAIIMVKIPYLTKDVNHHKERLADKDAPYISSYALGRDYHKVVKHNLNNYAKWIDEFLQKEGLSHSYRVFTDSAPIMEVQLASDSGLGWRGKNTLLLNKTEGSMFFLGEIFTDLPLTPDQPVTNHCGSCNKCIEVCPTKAFVSPYVLDAKRCISYLTIENKGPIPLEFRELIGNRIYGCDDCQLFCPWNKFSHLTSYPDFAPRNKLDSSTLLELFSWSEKEFLERMQGSAIFRIGYEAWLRNLAVGLGNIGYSLEVVEALEKRLPEASTLVAEHIKWALEQQLSKSLYL